MPKNILFLMADELRLDYVGYCPRSRLATPNIDSLGASVRFTNMNSVNPICTPARVALLTGRYSHQVNMTTMSGDLSQDYPTYPLALQRAGYATHGVGKFHFLQGWDWYGKIKGGHDLVATKGRMKAYGFDHVWEAAGKTLALRNYCDYCEHLDGKGLLEEYRKHSRRCGAGAFYPDGVNLDHVHAWPFDEGEYVDIVTADRIIDSIRTLAKGERPFFIFGSFCGPHYQYDPPQRYLDMHPYEEVDDFIPGEGELSIEHKRNLYECRRAYKAMVSLIDDQVGRIMRALEDEGLLDDTVVLFTADHGESMGDHFRHQKASPYWQSVVVPGTIRHPGHLDGRVCSAPVELTDITATILDVAGLDPVEALSRSWPSYNNVIPCRSLMPIVRGETDRVREFCFSESDANWHDSNRTHRLAYAWHMIKDDRWSYVRHHDMKSEDPDDFYTELLFEYASDPEELVDRAGDPAARDVLERMRRWRDWVVTTTPTAQTSWAPLSDTGARRSAR